MANGQVQSPTFNIERLPEVLKSGFRTLYRQEAEASSYLEPNQIYVGDARDLLPTIAPNSVALSVWSPPYFVGKEYEAHLSFDDWQSLLAAVIRLHFPILRPGGFLAINIADILCFQDSSMPRVQAEAGGRPLVEIDGGSAVYRAVGEMMGKMLATP